VGGVYGRFGINGAALVHEGDGTFLPDNYPRPLDYYGILIRIEETCVVTYKENQINEQSLWESKLSPN
jgi:hypothetical protein